MHKFPLLYCHVYHGTHSRELLTMPGNCQDCPEIFQTVLKLFSLLDIFQCLETFQTLWKFSRLSGNFPDSPETFQTLWKLSRLSANFPHPLTSRIQLTRALPQSWNTVSISLIAVGWEKWTGFWQFRVPVFVFVPGEAFALLEFQTPYFSNVKYWISKIYNSGTFCDTLATCLCISPCSPWESPDTFDSNRVPHPLDSRIPLLAIQYL